MRDDPEPHVVERERQRIWAAITSWEENTYLLMKDGTPTRMKRTFRPLAPFFDELRAMVFPDGDHPQGD